MRLVSRYLVGTRSLIRPLVSRRLVGTRSLIQPTGVSGSYSLARPSNVSSGEEAVECKMAQELAVFAISLSWLYRVFFLCNIFADCPFALPFATLVESLRSKPVLSPLWHVRYSQTQHQRLYSAKYNLSFSEQCGRLLQAPFSFLSFFSPNMDAGQPNTRTYVS